MELLFGILLLIAAAKGCPKEENIAPRCICKDLGDGPMMMCKDFLTAEELIAPIKATSGINMFSLLITNSSLRYIPARIFRGTTFQKIMVRNSQLMSLTDGDLAFEGLEDQLEELRVLDAEYVTDWDWNSLRNHRRIEHIDIWTIAMHSIDQELPALDKLNILSVSRAKIDFIHKFAFKNLANLRLLVMKENEISEVARTMFPDPANQLIEIDLSNNNLFDLPKDLFNRMPNLEDLRLSNNKLITLDEDTFQPVFQLVRTLLLDGNAFRCDCRLRWILDRRHPFEYEGACALPDNLNGVKLKYLNNKVLWC